jgi:23S rRNA-/tRNA-specific pseudouridylate synthase
MEPSDRSPRRVSKTPTSGSAECALSVLAIKPLQCASPVKSFDVEIRLETGRTHQIRAQLSEMGSPVVGDALYGSQSRYEPSGTAHPGIALFSASVSWSMGQGDTFRFTRLPPWH